MYRTLALVTALVMVALVVVAGCGGGGGSHPVAPPSTATTQQVFLLDFVHHTVTPEVQPAVQAAAKPTVKPQFVERNPGEVGAALELTLTINATNPGSPGQQQLTAVVRKTGSGAVGENDQGTLTGIDLCFVNTVFEDAGNNVVTGGGYAGYDSLNPVDGTPIYHISQALTTGAWSNPRLVDLSLPPTATQATVTVIVRADTQRFNAPDLNYWYLTTLAGQYATPGFQDGPAGQALFHDLNGSPLYRDALGDVLVADQQNGRIRRIYQGQVTTFAGDGTSATLDGPRALAQDAQGNVYIGENAGFCVDIVAPTGGAVTTIAGARGTIGDVSGVTGDQARFGQITGVAVGGGGNLVYVCDDGYQKMKLLTYSGVGSRFAATSWQVTDITNGAGFTDLGGVALDASGNVYVTDYSAAKIYVLPLGSSTWTVIAGSGAGLAETDGTGTSADFQVPAGIAVDQAGIVYVADSYFSLRRLTHTGGAVTDPTTWKVETLVPGGSEADGFTGTGMVDRLEGVGCARDGALYLTEDYDVRRLDRTRN